MSLCVAQVEGVLMRFVGGKEDKREVGIGGESGEVVVEVGDRTRYCCAGI